MKVLLCLLFIVPRILLGQDVGINFERNLTWDQILKKAKLENKYVFVDCYTTWCGPCKKMDLIYESPSVGKYVNENFISVKVQMDTTKKDNDYVKSWYPVAHDLSTTYKVLAYPTYLFFSSDGEIVHRRSGAMSDSAFISIAKDAFNSGKQYYSVLREFDSGVIDYRKVRYAAIIAQESSDRPEAKLLARSYFESYLNKIPVDSLYLQANLDFLKNFSYVLSSKDAYFRLLYDRDEKVDRILEEKGVAKSWVERVITKEEIHSKIYKDGKPIAESPNWKKLKQLIARKYNIQWAELTVLKAQINWADRKEDWVKYTEYRLQELDRYSLDTASARHLLVTNNFIYDIVFKQISDPAVLSRALLWMQLVVKAAPEDPAYLDTYANLLYKLGRKSEALKYEKSAFLLEDEMAKRSGRQAGSVYKETIEKMERGEPTW